MNRSLRWLRRRLLVLVLPVVIVPFVALLTTDPGTERTVYTSTAVFLVSPEGGLSSFDLATTYAILLQGDEQILDAVDRALGAEVEASGATVRATKVPNTPLLEVSFESSTERTTDEGMGVVLDALTSSPPATRAILPDSLRLVVRPTAVFASTTEESSSLPVAIVLGLVLAAVLVFALEQVDARVDDEPDLAAALGTPVSSFAEPQPGDFVPLLERWAELEPESDGVTVVPVDDRAAFRADAVGATLRHAMELALDGRSGHHEALTDAWASGREPEPLRVTITAPGSTRNGAVVTPPDDVLIILARAESRVSDIRATIARLEAFGARPHWGLLTY